MFCIIGYRSLFVSGVTGKRILLLIDIGNALSEEQMDLIKAVGKNSNNFLIFNYFIELFAVIFGLGKLLLRILTIFQFIFKQFFARIKSVIICYFES